MITMRILVFMSILCSVIAFAPVSQTEISRNRGFALRASQQEHNDLFRESKTAAVASCLAFLPVGATLAADELEIAELPPVYVPVLFGVVLLVGVGLLTSSLGNVMDEESSLGMQSGARAKKERDRSRSSYFKK